MEIHFIIVLYVHWQLSNAISLENSIEFTLFNGNMMVGDYSQKEGVFQF